jgi:ADP-ribose pyrophosphatase YjhB (NUDIX family)
MREGPGMSSDVVGAGDRWIPEDEYQLIISRVPIVCVDVLLRPMRDPATFGLIRRSTYDNVVGWCLVGGALLRNEPLLDGVERHVRATLGPQMVVDRGSIQLITVAEYFTEPRAGSLHDPRKHAVALTYSALCAGEAKPAGEAEDFAWFSADALPDITFGFGQGKVVREVVHGLGEAVAETT